MSVAATPATGRHGGRVGRLLNSAREGDRRTLLIAAGLLALLGFAVYGRQIMQGGFYLDDWSNAAHSDPEGGYGEVLDRYWDLTDYRPMLVIYVPLTHWVFGMHMGAHLTWSIMLAIFESVMLFGLLRTLGVRAVPAWIVAALVLVWPGFDSTRMWSTASMTSLATGLVFAGIWLALTGLRRGSWKLHAIAVVLFVVSIFTYEVTVPLVAAAGLLYVRGAGWRAARARWAVDLVAVVVCALWISETTPRTQGYDASQYLDRLEQLITGGTAVLARALLPVGPPRTSIVILVLLVVVGVGVALALSPRQAELARAARAWLALFGAGLVVAVTGWLVFVAADPYYTPTMLGMANRTNALGGVGVIMMAVAVLGILGTLVGVFVPRSTSVPLAVTGVLAAVVGGLYISIIVDHTRIWIDAWEAQRAGIGQLKTQVPDPPEGAVLYTTGYPANQAPGVPIFSASWDVDGMVKVQYDRHDLRAYPVIPGTALACEPTGVRLNGPGYENLPVTPYGKAVLVQVGIGANAIPATRRQCARQLPNYGSGAVQLEDDY